MSWSSRQLEHVLSALPDEARDFLEELQARHGDFFTTAPLFWYERAVLNRIIAEANAKEAARWN